MFTMLYDMAQSISFDCISDGMPLSLQVRCREKGKNTMPKRIAPLSDSLESASSLCQGERLRLTKQHSQCFTINSYVTHISYCIVRVAIKTQILEVYTMKIIVLSIVIGVMFSVTAGASEYSAFTNDMVKPYYHFKNAISLTSKKEDADKAKIAIAAFIEAWGTFAAKYADDMPNQLTGISDFSNRIKRPAEVGRIAADYLKNGNVGRAHTVLEEVRYLLWEMRVKSGIVSLSDKANDFHEAMEILLDHTAAAKEAEDAQHIYERYAAWFLIKWDDISNSADIASVKKTFDPAFIEGRKNILAYLDALKNGDLAGAKKLSGSVKGAYKKIWMLDNM